MNTLLSLAPPGSLKASPRRPQVNATDDLPCPHAGLEYVRVPLEDVPSADLR